MSFKARELMKLVARRNKRRAKLKKVLRDYLDKKLGDLNLSPVGSFPLDVRGTENGAGNSDGGPVAGKGGEES